MKLDLFSNGPILIVANGKLVVPEQESVSVTIKKPIKPSEAEKMMTRGGEKPIVHEHGTEITITFDTRKDIDPLNGSSINFDRASKLYLFNRKHKVTFDDAVMVSKVLTKSEKLEVEFVCTGYSTETEWK